MLFLLCILSKLVNIINQQHRKYQYMKNLFLAKISIENTDTLIFTNGEKYSPVYDSFPGVLNFSNFLNLNLSLILSIKPKLTHQLASNQIFLELIENQHIFATGCTYKWSDQKLNNTSEENIYKKVYSSDRYMLFYKGTRLNHSSNFQHIGILKNSQLTIPEAELVVIFNSGGEIIGYTLGNDVTAVDIETQNPLFQTQGKFYQGSVALSPLMKISSEFPIVDLNCKVIRNSKCIVDTTYSTKDFVRSDEEIVNQLNALQLTPNGGFIFLGCGAAYPLNNPLMINDKVIISSNLLPFSLENECKIV